LSCTKTTCVHFHSEFQCVCIEVLWRGYLE
jgi:hypothetical protein